MKSKKFKRIAAFLLATVMLLDIGSGNGFISLAADSVTVQSETGSGETAGETKQTAEQTEQQTEDPAKQESTTETTGTTETTETPDPSKTEDTSTEETTAPETAANKQTTTETETQAETQKTTQAAKKETVDASETQKAEADTPEAKPEAANVVEARAQNIVDLTGGNDITNSWHSMITVAQSSIRDNHPIYDEATKLIYQNVPILTWKANVNTRTIVEKVPNYNEDYSPWNWSEVSDIPITSGTNVVGGSTDDTDAMAEVWDGSRKAEHNFSDRDYLLENQVSALDGTLYDSATWERHDDTLKAEGHQAEVYRYQATVDLSDYDLASDSFTILPVTNDGKIYINDDIFVFIYPEGTELSDYANDENYFMRYLAFWTGSINDNTLNKDARSFHGRQVPLATQIDNPTGYAKLTDGWYTDVVEDSAGSAISYGYSQNPNQKKYVIDVLTDDYNEGGGMYRLELGAQKNVKQTITFDKVNSITKAGGGGCRIFFIPR